MRPMTVGALEVSDAAVAFQVRCGQSSSDVSFRVVNGSFGSESDFLVPVTLLPAMKGGADYVHLPGVSPRLRAATEPIQDIWQLWRPALRRVRLESETASPADSAVGGIACFFSAGVDSFFSALEHLSEVTHLVFVHGAFDPAAQGEVARNSARGAARELGKPLIEVETNARQFAASYGLSYRDYHGSVLAAVALLFGRQFRRVLVAATRSDAALIPFGSHPIVDPLWSTESLEIVHDGGHALRPAKVARLARNDAAMRWLQVCQPLWRDAGSVTDDGVNCGRCPKCVRTMVNLRAVGALERCQTLPDELDLDLVAQQPIETQAGLAFVAENLVFVERAGDDPALATALRACVERNSLDELGLFGTGTIARHARQAPHAQRRKRELANVKNSLSWRATAPLRALTKKAEGEA